MILRINQADYGKIIQALIIASDSESNANVKRKYNIARKKLARQHEKEILRKNSNKPVRKV